MSAIVGAVADGCRELASIADAVGSAVGLVLRLNSTVASRLVAALSRLVACLLLLLDRAAAVLHVLIADLVAFVADVGDAVSATAGSAVDATSQLLLVGSGVMEGTRAGVDAGTAAVRALCDGTAALVATAGRGVVFLCETTLLALTMIPYSIAYTVMSFFVALNGLTMRVVHGCALACQAVETAVRDAVLAVLEGARRVPPSAVLGAVILLLAALALRRLVKLMLDGTVPVPPVRRLTAALLRRLPAGRPVETLRLAAGVLLVGLHIIARCVLTFVRNVELGLRPGRRPAPPRWVSAPPAPHCAAPPSPLSGEARLCVVCRDGDKAVILLPCRHVCVCQRCSGVIGAGDRRCPMCRAAIHETMRVYL